MMYRKHFSSNLLKISHNGILSQSNSSTNTARVSEFTRLELIPKQPPRFIKKTKGEIKTEISQPRYKQMPIDQKWSDVWPTAQSFRPSVVPLPIFQGYVQKKYESSPNKFANAELMKIPNFLHLTPPAIDAHCEALKKFCTPWPKALKTDEDVKKHFPLEVINVDWIYTGPSLREPRARVVTLNFQLSDFNLDYRARDKFLRLVGRERYNKKTDTVTIEADRCPLRKQNYDYAIYVITALYHESKKKEDWENEKTEEDMEAFFFENSRSQKKVRKAIQAIHENNEADDSTVLLKYGKALEKLINESESEDNLEEFKQRAVHVLGLKENLELKRNSEE